MNAANAAALSIVALIPARAGSKRVPQKNIRRLGDHPLVAYTIAAARESGVFRDVLVSTDSEEFAKIARHYGAEVPFLRPRVMAGDTSRDIEWVEHTLRELEQVGRRYDCFSLLRPTSPLRTAETIRRAWREFQAQTGIDSLRAVEKCRQHPGKMWVVRGRRMTPLLPLGPEREPWHSSQYQSLPVVYVQNASLEIAWTHVVFEQKTIAGELVVPFFSEGVEGFDINDRVDWMLVERHIADGQDVLPHVCQVPFPPRERPMTVADSEASVRLLPEDTGRGGTAPSRIWGQLAYGYEGLVALGLGYFLFQMPFQLRDNLGLILDAQQRGFWETVAEVAPGYVRPLLGGLVKIVFELSAGHYFLAYKAVHAVQIGLLLVLFVRLLHVRSSQDFAVSTLATTMLVGIHTFNGTVREGFPINTFMTILVCCVAAVNLSLSRPRPWIGWAGVGLLAWAAFTVETGLLVWVCFVVGYLSGLSPELLCEPPTRSSQLRCVCHRGHPIRLSECVHEIGSRPPRVRQRVGGAA